MEYLAQIPEYRQARGQRHPLLALLLLVCVAMLCGARGQSRHRRLGALPRPALAAPAGLHPAARAEPGDAEPALPARPATPTVEAVLGRWAEQVLRLCPPQRRRRLEGIAVDGKRLRGSARQGAADAHLLSAFSHRLRVVLGQVGVPDKTNAIGAADALLLDSGAGGARGDRRRAADPARDRPHDPGQRRGLPAGGQGEPAARCTRTSSRAFAPEADATGLVGARLHGGRCMAGASSSAA